jgi:uncharacterized membrane protein YfcA
MLELYLPIAALSVLIPVILGAGGAVGFLSGLFGVGGGFLMTPLLMLIGIPADIAIASGACLAVATSVSSAVSQWKRGNVDPKIGTMLVISGFVGASVGGLLTLRLKALGQFEAAVALAYVIMLGSIGLMMLIESLRAILSARSGASSVGRRRQRHSWFHHLPLKTRFPVSRLYISVVPVGLIGAFVGFLSALMGVGGGFVLVPAMVYLLGMRTNLAVGTSAFNIVFVSAYATVLLATTAMSLDVVLALLLIIGGVVGTQIGTRAGAALNGEQLRFLLALLILAVGLRVGADLVTPPSERYTMSVGTR